MSPYLPFALIKLHLMSRLLPFFVETDTICVTRKLEFFRRYNIMNKNTESTRRSHMAKAASTALNAVLFVCANTNSCTMVHQPKAPSELSRYSKVK